MWKSAHADDSDPTQRMIEQFLGIAFDANTGNERFAVFLG